jgi:hypothetical protein
LARPLIAVAARRLTAPTPVTTVDPGPGLVRSHASPHPSFLAHATEQPAAGLLDHVELSVSLIYAQPIKGGILGFLDGTTGGLDPLHSSLLWNFSG